MTKVGNVLTSYYMPAGSTYWYQFGARLSMLNIDSNGYYVGIAVSAHSNSTVADMDVGSITLLRTCATTTNLLQCDQASNCEGGQVSGKCYVNGAKPDWEDTDISSNIFDPGSRVVSFGCEDANGENSRIENHITDGTTRNFVCERTTNETESTSGLIISPTHNRLSISKSVRVYGKKLSCSDRNYSIMSL